MELKIEFTDREITPWAGIAILKNLLERTKIIEQIQNMPLPRPGSNRGYLPHEIIIAFWLSIWCRSNKINTIWRATSG